MAFTDDEVRSGIREADKTGEVVQGDLRRYLIERGWLELDEPDPDWPNIEFVSVTDAGGERYQEAP